MNDITLVIDAAATSEHVDGPEWASCTLSSQLLDKIEHLSQLCKQHELSEVAVPYAIVWGGQDELQIVGGHMHVGRETFWFLANPSIGNFGVTAWSVNFGQLKAVLGQIHSGIASDDLPYGYLLQGSTLFLSMDDPARLADLYELTGEQQIP